VAGALAGGAADGAATADGAAAASQLPRMLPPRPMTLKQLLLLPLLMLHFCRVSGYPLTLLLRRRRRF